MVKERNPKILYISDVPVEYTSAGGLFMYRLFEFYPQHKLHIVQTRKSDQQLMLPNVAYTILERDYIYRIKKTRFHRFTEVLDILSSLRIPASIKKIVRDFEPEAIVSVTHRLSWVLAYNVSKKYKLPYHLVLHDDLVSAEYNTSVFRNYINKLFIKVYQSSHAQLCISEKMKQHYLKLTNVNGQVLLPFSGKNDIRLKDTDIAIHEKKSLNFCYAGSLYSGGYLEMLNLFAKLLKAHGHTLTVLATIDMQLIKPYEFLTEEHVSFQPFIDRQETLNYLLAYSDVNILLNSFINESAFELNFSSKIADYTSIPLPILLWGAESSGLIEWWMKKGYKGILTSCDETIINSMITDLQDLHSRKQLSTTVYSLGTAFSYEANYAVFEEGLAVS